MTSLQNSLKTVYRLVYHTCVCVCDAHTLFSAENLTLSYQALQHIVYLLAKTSFHIITVLMPHPRNFTVNRK